MDVFLLNQYIHQHASKYSIRAINRRATEISAVFLNQDVFTVNIGLDMSADF